MANLKLLESLTWKVVGPGNGKSNGWVGNDFAPARHGIKRAENEKTVKIILRIVGMLREFQGKGFGFVLLNEVLKKYYTNYQIFVETQSMNFPAQKLYQKSGFIISSIRYLLHWFKKYSSVIPAMKSRIVSAFGVFSRYSIDIPSKKPLKISESWFPVSRSSRYFLNSNSNMSFIFEICS